MEGGSYQLKQISISNVDDEQLNNDSLQDQDINQEQNNNIQQHNINMMNMNSQTPLQEHKESLYQDTDQANPQQLLHSPLQQQNNYHPEAVQNIGNDHPHQQDDTQLESFSLTKIEKDYLKYSQDQLLLHSHKNQQDFGIFNLHNSQLNNLQELIITARTNDDKNINNARDLLDPFQIGIGHVNNISNSNSLIQKLHKDKTDGENKHLKYAADRSVFGSKNNNSQQPSQTRVPIKTKYIYQKVATSRSANSSPQLKKIGKKGQFIKQQIGVKNSDQDHHYKLPSMAQFIQKSILPKKQNIINEIYIQKLNKFQNLVSIVGDGNIKLANQLVREDAQYNIQKSLMKEIQKQKQNQQQASQNYQNINSSSDCNINNQQKDHSVYGFGFIGNSFNNKQAQQQQIQQTKISSKEQTLKQYFNQAQYQVSSKMVASTSTDTNQDILNNYKVLLMKNQNKSKQKQSKSLVVSPQRSQSKVITIAMATPDKPQAFDWKQAYNQHKVNLQQQSIQVENEHHHSDMQQNQVEMFEKYHLQRKTLNSMIEKRGKLLFNKQDLIQQDSKNDNEVGKVQNVKRIFNGINNFTNILSMDGIEIFQQQQQVKNNDTTNKPLLSNQSGSKRSLIMIKKNGATIQKSHFAQDNPINDYENDLNSQAGIDSTDREGDDSITKRLGYNDAVANDENEINKTLREFETFHNINNNMPATSQERITEYNQQQYQHLHINNTASRELSVGSPYQKYNVFEYKQMPLVHYQFPLQTKFTVEQPKPKTYTPSISKKYQFQRDKKTTPSLSEKSQIGNGIKILNLQKSVPNESIAEIGNDLLLNYLPINKVSQPKTLNKNRNTRYQRSTDDKLKDLNQVNALKKISSIKHSNERKQELKLHIYDHANTLNEHTLDRQTYDSRVDQISSVQNQLGLNKQQFSNNTQEKSFLSHQDQNIVAKQQYQQSPLGNGKGGVRQRISVNNVLNSVLNKNQNPSPPYNKIRQNKISEYGGSSNMNIRDELIMMNNGGGPTGLIGSVVEDDISSKALNSSTYIKHLENRYQNSQIFENLFENLYIEDINMRPKLQVNKKHSTKLNDYSRIDLDQYKPLQIRGQLFSMPVSPINLKHKHIGEYELKQKRNNIIRARIDGNGSSANDTTQIISSKLVHKQFQMSSNHRKSTNLSNHSNNNSPQRQLSIDLRN